MLKYRFPRFPCVPKNVDVVRQQVIINVNSTIYQVIELPLDATSFQFVVPKASKIEVIRRWWDGAVPDANFTDSKPVRFNSVDTVAPPEPPSFGEPLVVGELQQDVVEGGA